MRCCHYIAVPGMVSEWPLVTLMVTGMGMGMGTGMGTCHGYWPCVFASFRGMVTLMVTGMGTRHVHMRAGTPTAPQTHWLCMQAHLPAAFPSLQLALDVASVRQR